MTSDFRIDNLERALSEMTRERDEAVRALDEVGKVLAKNGCDCECDHHVEDHDEDCDRCLACRISDAMQPKERRRRR